MAKVTTLGPNGTPIGGLSTVTFPVAPLNYEADFLPIEDGAGRTVYTDITSPTDQPATVRLQVSSRPNVYVGSSIDASAYLPNRKGVDIYVEAKNVVTVTDSEDASYLAQFPIRAALAVTCPQSVLVTDEMVEAMVARIVAALFGQGDATPDDGIGALLRGVTKKY